MSTPFSSPFEKSPAFFAPHPQASLTYMNPDKRDQSPGEVGSALGKLQQAYEIGRWQVGGPGFTSATCPGGYVLKVESSVDAAGNRVNMPRCVLGQIPDDSC